MRRVVRPLLLAVLALALLAGGVGLWGFLESRATPIVRRADLALADWPAGEAPVTVALLSDLHVGNLSTDVGRLRRVVAQVDALHPDLILIAGDFLAGHRRFPAGRIDTLLAPLAGLRAPLGVVAVLGNHDYGAGRAAVGPALAARGVTVLVNQALERGPLAIGGLDDPVTGHAALAPTIAALRGLAGSRLVMTHSPEIVGRLPPDVTLLLAGHTHCGQIRIPLLAPRGAHWRFSRYECGLVRDPGRIVVVGAGIGTSHAPLRFGTPPDVWLLTLGPPRITGQAPAPPL